MSIDQATHDAITEVELVALIDACGRCECPPEFACCCDKNLEWAERKLEQLRARQQVRGLG
jgi:hypothetical protein